MAVLPLVLSAVALLAAPLLDRGLRARPSTQGLAEGALQVFVGGLVLVHVLPFGLVAAGWPAAVALVAGVGLSLSARRVPGGERWALGVAACGLLLHCMVDGATLTLPIGEGGGGARGWAVVLHSLPVGLAAWRVAWERGGRTLAGGLLVARALATAVGWSAAEQVLEGATAAGLGIVQCLVAGALLHALGPLAAPSRSTGWGALLATGGILALALGHPAPRSFAGELAAAETVFTLLVEAAPALLLGYVAAGLLHAFAPAALPRWLTGRSALDSAARGALVGLPVPVCSCGALPLYRGLLAKGVPPAAALAFLVAGPEVGAGTVLVSLPLLGLPMTVLRVGGALLVALAVGVLVSPLIPAPPARTGPTPALPPLGARLREGLHFGLVETVEHTAPWVLAGLLLAGLLEPLLDADALRHVPGPLGVVGAALIGVPAYVCASGATPLVAVLVHKGLSGGAAVAFLLTGPATNISTFGVLRRLHGPRVALRFGMVVATLAVGLGLALDALWPDPLVPPLHAASAHAHGTLELASAAVLGLLFAAALVRNGLAGFLDPLLHPHHDHDHGAGEGHDHRHDHGGAGHAHAPPAPARAAAFSAQALFTDLRLAPAAPGLAPPVARASDCGGCEDGHDHGHDHGHRDRGR